MSLSERGVCSRALQAGGRPCPRPLFPEPVPPYVAQAEQQFAYGEAFLPGYLDLPEGDPAVGAGYAEQRAAVAFDAAGFFAVGGGFERAEYILAACGICEPSLYSSVQAAG